MSANANNQAPARQGQAPLNPERPPQLLGKYAKYLGKSLSKIEIVYDAEGVNVYVTGQTDTEYASLGSGDDTATIADFKAIREKETAPSDEDRLQSFKNKFELRLNLEFPAQGGPVSGSDTAIQAFLNGLPFRQRRALMMTQKQFASQYPNGYTQA